VVVGGPEPRVHMLKQSVKFPLIIEIKLKYVLGGTNDTNGVFGAR